MNKLHSGKKGLINLLCVAVLFAVLILGALAPTLADSDLHCIHWDDHGNCLIWYPMANVATVAD